MSLETLNATASIGTFMVIGVTAIAAVVQLRHLRASNSLTGLLDVLSRVEDPIFNEWLDRAKKTIESSLSDPGFRQSIVRATYVRGDNPWLNMCNSYEWVGSLVKHGLIPEEPFMDVYSSRILSAWLILEPIFALTRRRGDSSIWENFEYLVVRARRWEALYPNGAYPKGVPRLEYHDTYLAADTAAGFGEITQAVYPSPS